MYQGKEENKLIDRLDIKIGFVPIIDFESGDVYCYQSKRIGYGSANRIV